jgi:hypothetical protein
MIILVEHLSPTFEKGTKMLYAIEAKTKQLRVFNDEKDARSNGNGFITFTTPEELCANPNTSGPFLVDVYNNALPKEQVKKFADRATGAKRVFKLFTSEKVLNLKPAEVSPDENAEAIVENLKKVRTKKVQPRGKTAGSLSKKMVRSVVKQNPRREGTMAYDAFQILLDLGGKPISFEDYVSKGGRRNDLAYDIVHGWAEVCGDC